MARRHPEGQLISQDPAINTFLSEFQGETDRAAAVLGPAMLDQLLKDLLDASFVSGALAKKLTGKMMPIGTFSARITIAEAISLISSAEAKDLHRMREIRNSFAHELHGLSFETQSIRDSCGNFAIIEDSKSVVANHSFFEDYPTQARATFNLEVTLMVSILKQRIGNAHRIPPASLRMTGPAA
jgi:hypothetical protein